MSVCLCVYICMYVFVSVCVRVCMHASAFHQENVPLLILLLKKDKCHKYSRCLVLTSGLLLY